MQGGAQTAVTFMSNHMKKQAKSATDLNVPVEIEQ
jgi:hypothetical protein